MGCNSPPTKAVDSKIYGISEVMGYGPWQAWVMRVPTVLNIDD